MKKFNSTYVDEFLLEKFVNQWISKRMLETYYTVFNLLFLDSNIIPSDLSTYTTKSFKKFLWDNFVEKNWSSATYNSYRRYLRSYCQYLFCEEYLEDNPMDKILKRKEPQQLPKALSREQVKELLYSLETAFDKESFYGLRNITMVYTYLHTGLRLSELTNLKLENLVLMDWYLKVIKWKWGKDRVVPLDSILVKLLHWYTKKRKKLYPNDGYVFPTSCGNGLQKRDMRLMINRIRECITFYFTWHQLRHTFATELVRNNFDIYNISRILGHSKIDTTKIYLSVDVWRLKKQLDTIQLFS